MNFTKLHLVLAVGAAMLTSSAIAGPGPGNFPAGFPTQVKTKEQAMACCKPGEKVALACKDCKTAIEKDGAKEKKPVMSWFAADDTPGCSGWGGKITLKSFPAGKGTTSSVGAYTHVCTKC